MTLLIILILVSLILSGFFSGSEMAFVSANKLGIEVLKNKGHKKGRSLASFFEKPKEFLGTMLVGNNIALVVFTILMTNLIEPLLLPILGEHPVILLLIVTLISTIIVLIFGEYIPKTFFRLYANELLFRLNTPLRFFKWILIIPTWMMTGLSNFILKNILKIPVDETENILTRIDLEHYINDNIQEEETIDKAILTNALNLSQIKVRECMIPRTEIINIDKKAKIKDLVKVFKASRLSRIMVTDGDIENIIGYIHHQYLFDNPSTIKSILNPISYVPEAMNVQDLMTKFINDGTSIACVVDEFGGTAGLITLEDILEEIFGEIEDEHDQEESSEEQLSEDTYRFSGRTELGYVNEKFDNINIPEGEYHTLSGYIVMTNQSIPEEGEEIEINNINYLIESVSDKKIETIVLQVLPTEEPLSE